MSAPLPVPLQRNFAVACLDSATCLERMIAICAQEMGIARCE